MATFKLHNNVFPNSEAILARRLEYAAVKGDWERILLDAPLEKRNPCHMRCGKAGSETIKLT